MAKAKTAKKAKPQALNLDDVLSQATVKGTGKKKDDKIILPSTPATLELADAIQSGKREIENLTTEYDKNAEEARVLCKDKREKEIKDRDNFVKTIYIECSSGELIRCTQTDKWSVVDSENLPELRETCADLGIEFDDYFEVTRTLNTRKGVLDDLEVVSELITNLAVAIKHENLKDKLDGKELEAGKQKFLQMFEYRDFVKPVENYDKKQYDLEEKVREEINSFTKQAKASIVTK